MQSFRFVCRFVLPENRNAKAEVKSGNDKGRRQKGNRRVNS
jgi:hypothetical protein